MKKLNSGIMALLLGVVIAIGASAFKAEKKAAAAARATSWFATDREGNLIQPYQQVDPEELCSGGADFCAKEYNIDSSQQPVSETSSDPAMRPEL